MELKPIKRFPGYYVSREGGVFTRRCRKGNGPGTGSKAYIGGRPKPLKFTTRKDGHFAVSLCLKRKRYTFYVHKLVADAFLGKRPKGKEIRHWDGVPTHNSADNLLWGTHLENERDKLRHGTIARGEKHGRAKLTEEQVIKIRAARGKQTHKQIALQFNISAAYVSEIQTRKKWTHIE